LGWEGHERQRSAKEDTPEKHFTRETSLLISKKKNAEKRRGKTGRKALSEDAFQVEVNKE